MGMVLGSVMSVALASQSEVPLPLDAPFERLSDPGSDGVTLVPRVDGGASLGIHPLASSPQLWEGTGGADVTLVGIDDTAAVGGHLWVQTSADGENDIHFRLTRLYYDAGLAFDRRIGNHQAVRLGYRHRCSHGVDDVPGRILIRSGPTLSWEAAWGETTVIRTTAGVEATLIGQNLDFEFQPRALLNAGAGVSRPWGEGPVLIGAAAVGLFAVGTGTEEVWALGAPFGEVRMVPLPSAAVGLGTQGDDAARLLLHVERIPDTGLGPAAQPVTLWSIRVEFGEG